MRDTTSGNLTSDPERPPQPVAALILGCVLLVIGLLLLLRIFFGVASVISDPTPAGRLISAWENEVKGERPLVEFPAQFHLPTTAIDASGEPLARQWVAANGQIRLNLARPGAIAILLILLAILVKIAAHVTSAGIKILTAAPQRELLKEIVIQLQRSILRRGKPDEGAD